MLVISMFDILTLWVVFMGGIFSFAIVSKCMQVYDELLR